MRAGFRHFTVLGLLLALLVPVRNAAAAETAPVHPRKTESASLGARLDRIVAAPRFRHAQWGIHVVDLRTGTVLYEHGADRLLTPASLTKLFTAALALECLGGEFRLSTRLYAAGTSDVPGTLSGPLILRGEGDPGFRWEEGASRPLRSFDPLVEVVRQAGIREIHGGLVAVETFLGSQKYGPGWSWEDLAHGYGASLSDFPVNENRMRLEVSPGARVGEPCEVLLKPEVGELRVQNLATTGPPGRPDTLHWSRLPGQHSLVISGSLSLDAVPRRISVSMEEPAEVFLKLFRQALEDHGVRVHGPLRVVTPVEPEFSQLTASATLLGEVRSAPVRDWVQAMLKRSENLYASILWATVMRAIRNSSLSAEEALLTRPPPALTGFLRSQGIPGSEVFLEEGSGLSRNNLVTPRAVVALLRAMPRHPEGATFRAALPVAGRDGTLAERMAGTAAEDVVHAKTGTLRWAHGLAGYVLPKRGRSLAFCLLLNRYEPGPGDPPPGTELDRLAILLAEWARESPAR